ncbi:MAG: ABC transporter substrate-binding protein [Sneathiellaceae bacterium]
MQRIGRRGFLMGASAIGLAGAAGLGLPRPAWAASAEIGIASPDPIYCVSYIAFQKGYFKDAGLDASYIDTQSGPRGKQMLAAGQVFATTSGTNDAIALTLAGKPARIVFSLDTRITYANLLVRKDDLESGKITKISDLAGQTIAVTQPQSATWLMATYMSDKAGILDKVDIRGLGGLSTMLGALKSGQVGASIATLGMVEAAVAEGWAVPLFDVTEAAAWSGTFGGDVPGLSTYVLEETIEERPQDVQAFVTALCKAQDFLNSESAETIAGVVREPYLSSMSMEGLVKTIALYKRAVWNKTNMLTPEAYARLVDIMGDGRQYTNEELAKVPYKTAVDMSFVEKARGL